MLWGCSQKIVHNPGIAAEFVAGLACRPGLKLPPAGARRPASRACHFHVADNAPERPPYRLGVQIAGTHHLVHQAAVVADLRHDISQIRLADADVRRQNLKIPSGHRCEFIVSDGARLDPVKGAVDAVMVGASRL